MPLTPPQAASTIAFVLRRCVAFVLVATVHVSAVTAPLAHVHLDDHDTDHHHAGETHAHLTPHHGHTVAVLPSGLHGPLLADHDGEQRTLDASLFLVVKPDAVQLSVALPLAAAIVLPESAPASRVPQVAHGPDPPDVVVLAPRAPPHLLSLI